MRSCRRSKPSFKQDLNGGGPVISPVTIEEMLMLDDD